MLLNNFKPLLFFGGGGTFKDVSGSTVNVSDFLTAFYASRPANNHSVNGVGRSFDYTVTTTSNNCVSEQTSYTWANVTFNGSDADVGFRYNGFTLFVGSGNTAVTANDYCLDTPVTLNVVAASCTTNASGLVTVLRTFENNTGSSVTINEIGLYVFAYFPATAPVVMIGRKVLSTPVTIPNGEQRTFEYIVDMNHISFSEADN